MTSLRVNQYLNGSGFYISASQLETPCIKALQEHHEVLSSLCLGWSSVCDFANEDRVHFVVPQPTSISVLRQGLSLVWSRWGWQSRLAACLCFSLPLTFAHGFWGLTQVLISRIPPSASYYWLPHETMHLKTFTRCDEWTLWPLVTTRITPHQWSFSSFRSWQRILWLCWGSERVEICLGVRN